MTKRQKSKLKHAKKSKTKRVKRPTTIPIKKGTHKIVKNKRPKRAPTSAKKSRKIKVVAKVRTRVKQKLSKPIRRNKQPARNVKRSRSIKEVSKRRKTISKSVAKSKAPLRKRNVKKIVIPEFSETKKLKISKHLRHDKEGNVKKEKVIPGNRQYWRINLPKGNFEKSIDTIRNGNFSFLNAGLNRNRPIKGKGSKEPRAVVITIENSYRGKNHYHRKISDTDFIVRKESVKKLILDRMVEYQDNWLERADEQGDEYLEGSGKAFAPKNITAIMIEFIY